MTDYSHKCFGCGKEIQAYDPHIHVDLEEWARANGEPPLSDTEIGLGELFKFAFCEACTEKGGRWSIEAHDMEQVCSCPDPVLFRDPDCVAHNREEAR